MNNDWLALHGIPAGISAWEKLPVRTIQFNGVQDNTIRERWDLDSFVEEILPHYNRDTILIGHDLGGVVASMAALQKTPRAVVLTGTALGSWWFWTRLSAAPLLNRFFYHTFKGKLFVRMGGGQSAVQRFSPSQHSHDPVKMKTLAKHMSPPKDLAFNLSQRCPVFLIWGKKEVFYPRFVAKSLSKSLDSEIFWNDGGHYSMWTHSQSFLAKMTTIEERLAQQPEY